MTPILRDARKLRLRPEGTGKWRVALLVGLQLVLLGGAFGGGYLVAGLRTPVTAAPRAPFNFHDPLSALDEPPRAAYTFHERLTAPRAEEPRAPAPAAAPAPSPPRPVPAPPRPTPRSRAMPAAPEGDVADVRALEEQVRALAQRSARAQGHVTAAVSTDDELRAAMQEAAQTAPRPRAHVELADAPRPAPRAAPAPAAALPKPVAKPAGHGRFTLQVKSFPQKDRAEELVDHLRQRGVEAYLVAGELRGKGKWFRVRVGRFASRDDAERFRRELVAKQNTDSIVTVVR